MDNDEEIVRRVVDFALQEVAPRLQTDPLVDPPKFLHEAIQVMQRALVKRLADLGNFQQSFSILELTSLSYDQSESVRAKVKEESTRLRDVGEKQRIIALVGFVVREIIELRPDEVRAAVSALTRAQNEGLREARLASESLAPAPADADPLVKALSSYEAGGLRQIRGFLGESERPGYRRLYSNLELDDFIDIPRDAIIQAVDLRTIANPLGGAAVWVRIGAEIYRGRRSVSKTEIQGQFLAGATGGGAGAMGDGWTALADGWTSLGRGDGWTALGRGDGWTALGRGDGWTSLSGQG